jgi:hypothetical protein
MTPSQIIASLNALGTGEIDGICARLDEARSACIELDQSQLADHLGEAGQALLRADLKTYRKRVETVISQLGHLR